MKKFKKWIRCAGVRAVRTMAQTAVSTIGVATLIDEINWVMVLSTSALAGILSLLTSLSGLPELKEGD